MEPAVGRGQQGRAANVELAQPAIRVVVSARLGARVVSLVDRRTGREWLVQDRARQASVPSRWTAEEAVFGADEAFGWDECLPTVAPSRDPHSPEGPPLRDHGNYWGRPAATRLDRDTIITAWPADRWGLSFLRRLRLDASAVIADYALHNPTRASLPFLWAAHPLLRLDPGTRLHLPKVDRVAVTGVQGVELASSRSGWPRTQTSDGRPLDLDLVQPDTARLAIKAFARGVEGRAGALAPDGSWIGVAWEPSFAPALGLWLDYGGWPQERPLHQVALEPTTSAADALDEAIASRHVATVAAGRTARWWMRVEVGTQAPGLAAFLRG